MTTSVERSLDADPHEVFFGASEMAQLMRKHDWAATGLGPVETWPQSLRSALSILLSSKAEIVLFWGPDLIALYNDAYAPAFGEKHPWALGRPARECWSEVWDIIGPIFENVVTTGEAFWGKAYQFFLNRHGYLEEAYYDVSYDAVRAEGGLIGGVFCIVSDKTGEVIGERRLRTLRQMATETSLTHTVEEACRTAADIIGQDDSDIPFALIYLVQNNKAVLAATSNVPAGRPESPFAIDFSGCSGDLPAWPIQEAIATGKTVVVRDLSKQFEALPTGPWEDQTETAVVIPLTLLEMDGGNSGALVAGISARRALDSEYLAFLDLVASQVATAVTNARNYEAERQRAESLAELDRAKTVFFSNVSHEFRTPLTLMMGPLQEILNHENTYAEVKLHAETAYRNSLRLLKLVNTLLDFARIESGRVEAVFERTDIAHLTVDLASAFRSAVERAGLLLEVDCEPIAQEVYVDRDMWEKIVLNLVSNALKFTFEGTITVRLTEANGSVLLNVRDTGVGIPEDELPHIFERFRQVRDTRSRTQEGSGIGLALVRELVNLHGGTITVESELGVGTEFSVRVPTGAAHLPVNRIGTNRSLSTTSIGSVPFVDEALSWVRGDAAAPEIRELWGRDSSTLTQRSTVLIADDNADMRDYLTRLLEERFVVISVENGLDAVAAAKQKKIDLVLLDVMMPGLDGFEVLQQLRDGSETASLPVIMLSARAGDEARVSGLEAGADDYLVKPFSSRELLARVGLHLELARARRESEEQRKRLYELFQQAPAPICVLSGDELVFEFANRPYIEVVGGRDVVGLSLLEALPELSGQGFDDLLRKVMRNGAEEIRHEARIMLDRRGTGLPEESYFNFTYTPLHEPDGSMVSVMAFGYEVTDQVNARNRIEEANAALRESVSLKDQFLGLISHELRTPISTILGYASLMQRSGERLSEEDKQQALADVHSEAVKLQQVIENLLLLTRTELKTAIDLEPVSVEHVLKDSVATFMHRNSSRVVSVSVAPNMPIVSGQPEFLKLVIDNLLSNAAKYSPETETIEISAHEADAGKPVISVRDHGIGMTEEELTHVFEPFYRAPGAKLHAGGMGVGLAVCKRLTEVLGGTISVMSSPGQGSEFVVSLCEATIGRGSVNRP